MANVEVTDVQLASSKMTTQPPQADSLPVTQEPPSVYTQGYINETPNPYQHQTGPAVIHQNGQRTTMILTSQRKDGPIPIGGTTAHVTDYTVWSIFNMCCCCFIFGAIALYKCSVAKRKQIVGDIQGAEKASRSARACNVTAMFFGTSAILWLILEKLIHISK